MKVRRALFSVAPTEPIAELAEMLADLGWEIVATPDAHDYLDERGISSQPVAEFNDVRGDFPFPATLHPRMELALTGDGEERVDLVFDLPYGPEAGNDVGGWTLLALAAKGERIPVFRIDDMRRVVAELQEGDVLDPALRRDLVAKANAAVAAHYAAVSRSAGTLDYWDLAHTEREALANGENPYQTPAYLCWGAAEDDLALHRFTRLAGNAPCFTNMADMDAVVETLCKLSLACEACDVGRPYLVVAAKHGNACGVGVSFSSPGEAIERALWGDPMAIWGGEVVANFDLDGACARDLQRSGRRRERWGSSYWMLDVVAAPSFSGDAVEVLGKNKNRKLFANPALEHPTLRAGSEYRPVRGGVLVQPPADFVLSLDALGVASGELSRGRLVDLIVAWAVAYSSSLGGNEIALARGERLLGAGGGPSTWSAAKAAVMRARECGHDLSGATFAADAFFPFTDAPEVLADAGASSGVVPSGGKRIDDVVSFFEARRIGVHLLSEQWRGFCRH